MRLNYHILKLYMRLVGVLNSDSTQASGEEHLLKLLSKKYKEPIIFDVGANEGGYSALTRKYIPNSTIYAFEPGIKSFAKLKDKQLKKLHIYNVGLSDKKGTAYFYDFSEKSTQKNDYPVSAMASLSKEVFTKYHREKPKSRKINLETIDNFVKKENIRHIDFLKIDTEGYEYHVLKGAMKTIMKKKIDVIQFEFNEMNVYTRVFLRDFIELLVDFKLYRLMPDWLLSLDDYSPKTHELFGFQNIVAIRKDLKPDLW